MKNRILLAGVLGCLMMAAIPGVASASTITPEGPFTATSSKVTFNLPEARFSGGEPTGLTINCTSSAINGTVKNNPSAPSSNPITPGPVTFGGCTPSGPYKTASVTTNSVRNLVITPSVTLLSNAYLSVNVNGCVMEFATNQVAYYPTNSLVKGFAFENARNASEMKMTKIPSGLFCELTFRPNEKATMLASYTLNSPLTVTN